MEGLSGQGLFLNAFLGLFSRWILEINLRHSTCCVRLWKKITRKYVWMSLSCVNITYYIFNPRISHDLPWVISEPHTYFSGRWVDIEALLWILSTEHNNVLHWNKNRRCHWPALILRSCLTSTSYRRRGKFVCYVLWPRSFPDLFGTRQEGCQAALCSAPAQTLHLKGTQLKNITDGAASNVLIFRNICLGCSVICLWIKKKN